MLDLSGDQKGIQLRQSSAESGSDSTKWTLTQNADQTWSIQNMADGTYVDLTADSGVTSNGNPVVAYPYHGMELIRDGIWFQQRAGHGN